MTGTWTENEDGHLCAHGPQPCLKTGDDGSIRTLDDLIQRYDWLCKTRPEFVQLCQGELL